MYDGNSPHSVWAPVIEQESSRTRVVYRSSGTTYLLSLALNQNAASWEMAHFLVTQLSDAERLRTEVQLSPSKLVANKIRCLALEQLPHGRFSGAVDHANPSP